MTRVIVHAGFHKTGTTSLQSYLAQNRARLAPFFAYYGQNDFKSAGARARVFAQRPFPWRMAKFRAAFHAFLDDIPDADTIVLSRETFCGVMPGHRTWRRRTIKDFKTAGIPLCRTVIQLLRERFGPDVRIEFLFTTREREAWIRSVYGHLLRSIHLRVEFEEFRAGFPNLIDLEEEAKRIASALDGCTTHIRAMESYGTHHNGPAAAILELAGVDAATCATLPRAARANEGQPPELEAAFLELNRSGKSKHTLRHMKNEMLARKDR